MKAHWRKTVVVAITGLLFGTGGSSITWAEEHAGRQGASGVVHEGIAQMQQHKQQYKDEISSLEAQRQEALKSGNKEQARELTGQIRQLREQGRDQKRQDIQGLREERQQWKQEHAGRDRDNNPPGPVGGAGTNWENRPGPAGGPGAGADRRFNPPGPAGGPGHGGVGSHPGGGPRSGGGRRR